MAHFKSRRQVTTRKPELRVDPGLPAGKYRFKLVVVGFQKKKSKPTYINVTIVNPNRKYMSGKTVDAGNKLKETISEIKTDAQIEVKKKLVRKKNAKKLSGKIKSNKENN